MSQHDTLTPDQLDQHLDAILKGAGSALRHYTMQKSRDDMRAALRAALRATQPAQAAQSEPTLRDYADDLVDAGHDFWKACKREAGGGAVRWLSCDDGTLIVFTRGEYRHQIMSVVSGDAAPTTVLKDDEIEAAQAAQSEPVKPLFASKVASRKWSELQEAGARMQSIAFDGHKSGQPGTIDPWGVVRWGQAAQGAGEVVYQIKGESFCCSHAWRDATEEAFNVTPEQDRRVLYTHPTAQPAPVVPEVDALTDKIASMLHGAYHCLRVWEAWRIGTMSEDDFESVGESDSPREIAEAILEMLAATPTPPAQAAADARDAGVDAFLADVRAEIIRARAKFPGARIMTVALAEEFGELVKAVLDESAANVRKEAVQTATMCARVVLDGDGSVDEWRAEKGLDALATHQQGGK